MAVMAPEDIDKLLADNDRLRRELAASRKLAGDLADEAIRRREQQDKHRAVCPVCQEESK